MKNQKFPVIDLFAGPGGLGEGFASYRNIQKTSVFSNILSVEQDENAFQTLLLRHFFRSFETDSVPDSYYHYLAGEITKEKLFTLHEEEYKEALNNVHCISLGPKTHSLVRNMVKEKLRDCSKWVLVGGPPCQAYSLAGRSRMRGNSEFEKDERHLLYEEYLRLIVDHKPPVFLMENVKGLLSARLDGKLMISRILSDLKNPGKAITELGNTLQYRLYSLTKSGLFPAANPKDFIVKAEEHGVPQARHRMFILGIRDDLDISFSPTLKTLSAPSVKKTIGNLGRLRSSLSKDKDSSKRWLQALNEIDLDDITAHLQNNPYSNAIINLIKEIKNSKKPRVSKTKDQSYKSVVTTNHPVLNSLYDPRLTTLTGHETRGHMESDLRRYLYASVFARVTGSSPKLADFPPSLTPDHQNVELGKTGKMFSDRFRVQIADQVSRTITSHISKDGHYYIHYDPAQCRSLTVREAARLQTFSDNYKFEGPRTSQFHQIGNAVPPYLAGQIAEIIFKILKGI